MIAKRYKPQALIFDLDGTLFRTETLSIAAYHETVEQLRREGLYVGETPADETFLSSLGLLLSEIWERVLPDTSNEVRSRANELLLYHQLKRLAEGQGELYPGVKPTLEELHRRGYQLFVASNGLESYVKGVIRHKELGPLFTDVYSAGEYQTRSKIDLVRLLLDTHHIQDAWMCGDRSSDVEAGIANHLLVVGCNYGGFNRDGELRHATIVLHSFPDLLEHLV
ncbi:MAG: HAD hydrolase-like protein [Alicyclobacillus sp.]|nr:HAD hydrolase-like protein [Alicyclobacillus sp.]